MIGTGLAILGAGLLGAGATAWGANKAAGTQADAANNAASIQAQGQQRALDFQQGVFNKQSANFDASKASVADANDFLKGNANDLRANYTNTAGNLNPFIQSGQGANNVLSNFYGLNGGNPADTGAMGKFFNSPDYQFALKGGSDALDNSAAAKGSALGGNQIRAQTEYGQGLATQNLSNYLTRLSGISQQGQGAAGTLGALGAQTGATIAGSGTSMLGGATNMASVGAGLGGGIANTNAYTNLSGSNNIAQSVMGAGTANASGTLGTVKGIDAGLNSLSLYNQMGKSSYGGGSSPNYLSSYNGNQIGGLY